MSDWNPRKICLSASLMSFSPWIWGVFMCFCVFVCGRGCVCMGVCVCVSEFACLDGSQLVLMYCLWCFTQTIITKRKWNGEALKWPLVLIKHLLCHSTQCYVLYYLNHSTDWHITPAPLATAEHMFSTTATTIMIIRFTVLTPLLSVLHVYETFKHLII